MSFASPVPHAQETVEAGMKQMALTLTDAESQGWPILEPIDLDEFPRPVAINKDVCVVGSRPEVNLKLSSPLVSRTHAIFVADHDSIYLRDLASRNHTYLNEKPIREAVLRDGDVITLGKLSFRCKSGFDRPYDPTEVHAPAAELRPVADGKRIPLNTRNSRSTLIGSREDCDVVVKGKDVEPSHAVIFEREGHRYIRDLRTVSGTWVNDAAVGQIELQPGDEIRIADARFVYELAEATEEEGLPPDLPLATEPAAASASGEADPLDINDEHVDLELADETAERIPESVGLSDWDAADLMSAPRHATTAPNEENEPAAEDFAAGIAVPPEPATETAAAPRADDDVIPIALDDLSSPAEVPAEAGNHLADSQPAPASAEAKPADLGDVFDEPSREPLPEEPIELASVAPSAPGEPGPQSVPSSEEEPAQKVALATEDRSKSTPQSGALSEAAFIDNEAQPASPPEAHPGQHDRLAPEQKLTELLDHLADDLEQVRSTWEEVQSNRSTNAGGDHPGTLESDVRSGAGNASPEDPHAKRTGKGHAAQLAQPETEPMSEV
jgi:pSer/pThr/pTyr-binding forkhead associated (FHA) protein